jgi:glucose-1-phosphate thymidylyltransferase
MMKDSFGPPFTLDQAYPFVRENLVAFGFPDILFGPDDIFQRLLSRQKSESSDIVLGLYRPHDPKMMDMVEMAKDGMVRAMYLKPENSKLKFAWLCAVWAPVFSQFMHDFIRDARQEYKLRQFTSKPLPIEDVSVGAVIQNAIQKGLRVHGVSFRNEQYLDIGTPKDLAKAVKLFGWQSY